MKTGACCVWPPSLKRRARSARAGLASKRAPAHSEKKAPHARGQWRRRPARRRPLPVHGLVAGAGAVLEGGVVGVVAGGCDGAGLGALLGVFSDVVVVGGAVALLAKSSQAPTARRATT